MAKKAGKVTKKLTIHSQRRVKKLNRLIKKGKG